MRVSLDEQIFAIQRFGGISRVFAELARQFVSHPELGVELQPVAAPLVNEYILRDPLLIEALVAKRGRHWGPSIARSLVRRRHRGPANIVHNTFYFPRALADYAQAKSVVTIHDMIPELMPRTRRRLDLLTLKHRYVRSADQVICVSESTKQDLLKVYGLIEAPIHVIHHGVSPRFQPGLPRADFLPGRYVLFVGHRYQYKDAEVLFRAFEKVAKQDADIQLLCVGGNGLGQQEARLLEDLGIRERVSQRFLSDELMASAYANAEVFVFPSHFEGFGLPALEAMASGIPTILARATSLPEIGGDAALYFEPGAVSELSDQISAVLNDAALQRDLTEKGLKRSSAFTWERAANETASVYKEALS